MGYSHYFEVENSENKKRIHFSDKQFAKICDAVAEVLCTQDDQFLLDYLEDGPLPDLIAMDFSKNAISKLFQDQKFINVDFKGMETLFLPQYKVYDFNSCKTNERIGDDVVAACIMAICDNSQGKLKFDSDGNNLKLMEAYCVFEQAFGKPFTDYKVSLDSIYSIGYWENEKWNIVATWNPSAMTGEINESDSKERHCFWLYSGNEFDRNRIYSCPASLENAYKQLIQDHMEQGIEQSQDMRL